MDREKLLQGLDIEHALFGTFFAFSNRLQKVGDSFYDEITCKQFFLLICLSLFSEPPTINELSEVMGSSHQNVKSIADKLIEKGFIKVEKDIKDKRKQRIKATKKMLEFGKMYEQRETKFMDQFYDGIDEDDLKITYDTINRLEANLVSLSSADEL